MIVYSKTIIKVEILPVQLEFKANTIGWQAHFNKVNYNGNWSAYPLRTPGGTDSIVPDALGGLSFKDHANMALFPTVKQLLERLNCEVMAVRLLNLSAGSVIKPHRDNELAFEMGEARLHIPVFTNPQVEFYVNNERVVMDEGDCWYINANLKHSVANRGTTDRIHLVIDCKVNEWLKGIIETAEDISIKNDEKNADLAMIINELRLQNTEASNKVALQLEQQLNHPAV